MRGGIFFLCFGNWKRFFFCWKESGVVKVVRFWRVGFVVWGEVVFCLVGGVGDSSVLVGWLVYWVLGDVVGSGS